jgi:D-alanine-D-alanine ligase
VARKKLTVGFTYDAKADYVLGPDENRDKYAEFDSERTLTEIAGAIESGGHRVVRIGHVRSLLPRLLAGERWDIVFNIAEGVKGRNRESQVPLLLELFDIPYAGSDALTMGICQDKTVAKTLVRQHGLATPDFLEVSSADALNDFSLPFPVFVKPSEEGTSKGISGESVVRDRVALQHRTRWLIDTYHQPALIERFIAGQEFTVAVVGNDAPQVLPPVQVAINGVTDLGTEVYSHARVENDEIQYLCPSPAGKELDERLRALALGAYKALGCRDLSRIDLRVDEKGIPYFLECNPLPNLGHIDVFPLVAKAVGLTYEQIILRIFDHACARYGL